MAESTEIATTLAERPGGETLPQAADDGNDLIRFALENGADVEVLERLVALQERVADRNAEIAMAEALAAFQESCPPILQTRKGHHGNAYAPLDQIARTIRRYLSEHGLSYTHDGELTDKTVEVTCTLRHVAGATRTATFRGPIDTSGGKNPIQQVASARSYGRRYTLTDVLGLTTTEDDDDGNAAGSMKVVTESQAADLSALADEVGADKDAFLDWFGVESFAAIPADRLREATNALERKRSKGDGS